MCICIVYEGLQSWPTAMFFSIGGAEIHGIHEECGGQSTSAGAVSEEMVGSASEDVFGMRVGNYSI